MIAIPYYIYSERLGCKGPASPLSHQVQSDEVQDEEMGGVEGVEKVLAPTALYEAAATVVHRQRDE